jgi:hypothetical protein
MSVARTHLLAQSFVCRESCHPAAWLASEAKQNEFRHVIWHERKVETEGSEIALVEILIASAVCALPPVHCEVGN